MNFPDRVKVYIVGGYVRDRLLGRECKDHDFVVVGSTPEEMLSLGFQQVGADFPVFLHPQTGDEFALARTERKVGVGYGGFETDFGCDVTLDEDLGRRDLTINSMAREVIGWNELGHAKLSDTIIDPFGGQEDLRDGVLCHTTNAFAEDPLRVLRVARFRARYGFNVATATIQMMKSLVRANEMEALTAERVWAETEKALDEEFPQLYFETLEACGARERLFPGMIGYNRRMDLSEASHLQRAMLMFYDTPVSTLEALKMPTDTRKAILVFQVVLLARFSDADTLMHVLTAIDALRRPEIAREAFNALPFFTSEYTYRATIFNDALDLVQGVTFASLPQDMQEMLSGKEIGEAIRQMRVATLDGVFRNRLVDRR